MIRRLHSILVIATLAVSACSTGAPEFSVRFDAYDPALAYDRGRTQFQAGQYGLAVQSFERSVASSPNSIDALNGLAAAYDKIGRFDLAQRHYERALRLDPVSIQTLNNLGYSYYLQERYDLAAVFLQDAYWLSQETPQVQGNRSLLQDAAGQSQEHPQVSVVPQLEPSNEGDAKPPLKIVRISRREQALVKTAQEAGDTAIDELLKRDKTVGHGDQRPTLKLVEFRDATVPETEALAPVTDKRDAENLMLISVKPFIDQPTEILPRVSLAGVLTPWPILAAERPSKELPRVSLAGMMTPWPTASSESTDLADAPSSRIEPSGYWGDETQIAAMPSPRALDNESYW